MAEGRVLIVAPNSDLRHSLEFALESEGYHVTGCATIEDIAPVDFYDCTVLDHQAARRPTEQVAAFCARSRPMVLLAGRPAPWLSDGAFRTLEKPLLGPALVSAVEDALASRKQRADTK